MKYFLNLATLLLVGVTATGQVAYFHQIDSLNKERKEVRSRYYGSEHKDAIKDTLRMIDAQIEDIERTISANAKTKAEHQLYKTSREYQLKRNIGKHFNDMVPVLGSPTTAVPGFNGEQLYTWKLGSKKVGTGIYWGWGIATSNGREVDATISATFDSTGVCIAFSTQNVNMGLSVHDERYKRKVYSRAKDIEFAWKSQYQREKYGWE